MVLQLINLPRGDARTHAWIPPFDRMVAYDNEHWWCRRFSSEAYRYVQALQDGVEVARLVLDDPGGINPAYAGAPELGTERLEIQFVEVATESRRRGIGGRVVRALAEQHSSRRLFAYSEKADNFWTSLGWNRFDNPQQPRSRSLFIQPQ